MPQPMKEIFPGIVIDPAIKFGKPVIKGTRIPVELVLAELANGMRLEELEEEYRLAKEQIFAALRYAKATVANEEIVAV